MKKISLIIPVFNEEENLRTLYDALLPLINNELTKNPYNWEVLLINDGSLDRSAEITAELRSKDSRLMDINLSRNFGKENAMAAGFDLATGDAVIIMDADLQHPVETIPEMIHEWEQGWHDVYGLRNDRETDSWLKRRLAKIYYRILRRSTRIDVLVDAGDFRLLDRRCVIALRSLRETQRNTKILYNWIGFKKKEVRFDYRKRNEGETSFSYGKLFKLALDGITGVTTAPLRVASIIGLLTSAGALIYLMYILIKTILYGDPVQGFPTIMITILFLGGIQLLALGIIGEYIGRIFMETKKHPLYIIDTINGESEKNKSQS
ncbi:MAG: glycosyltransferase family 2 protein [Muribaculaceae bacterium]|nr:glycosyltransferase family 2 protein [Muribaculaceae bacterium]